MSGPWRAILRALAIRTPEERAVAAVFRALHPEEPIAWTSVAADEPRRLVVGVYHGDTRPPSYAFFAFEKATREVRPLEDDAAYRPKDWR